jgi:manganese efflux pump family protein
MDSTALIGEILTLFFMAFALGMDAFSIGLGMGMVKLRYKQIFKVGITIGIFHMMMPLCGMFLGRMLSDHFGNIAAFIGGLLLLVLGIQMIIASFREDKDMLVTPMGIGLIIFAISVSLDSFSVGLSLGIFGTRTFLTIMMFGLMSMILTWVGLIVGKKVQGWLGSYSEALGGCILLAFGLKILLPI